MGCSLPTSEPQRRGLPRRWAMALLAGGLGLLLHQPRAASAQTIPLDCRLGSGVWQPCTLTIERLGEHWWLDVAGERLHFRSDGRGSVQLQQGQAAARRVEPRWESQQALCWDGVCAKGELPLD